MFHVKHRKRCFIFNPNQIEDFEHGIVLFIKKFIVIYCCNLKLHDPVIFCILGYDKNKGPTAVTTAKRSNKDDGQYRF